MAIKNRSSVLISKAANDMPLHCSFLTKQPPPKSIRRPAGRCTISAILYIINHEMSVILIVLISPRSTVSEGGVDKGLLKPVVQSSTETILFCSHRSNRISAEMIPDVVHDRHDLTIVYSGLHAFE